MCEHLSSRGLTLRGGAVTMAALMALSVSGRDITTSNATWKYLDASSAPAAEWQQAKFDDSSWKSGAAPLGYGEERLQTEIRPPSDSAPKPITTWFRQQFDAPGLASTERCVLLLSVDDSAVVYLNGHELGRLNLPKGALTPTTTATREISKENEGFFYRVPVPAGAVRSQGNLLAIEVHQASANDSDLFLDARLKTLPSNASLPEMTPLARTTVNTFHQKHYLGANVVVPNGYIDGGRHMAMGASGKVESGREILLVDRAHDPVLAKDLAYAASPEMKSLPPIQRVQRLAAHIHRETTPPGGLRLVGPTIDQLTQEFAGKPLLLGDVVDQSQAGVCRHRALLFKLLADAAGLKTALVRGNYAQSGPKGFPHAWNEVFLPDGRRVLVDVMHHGGEAVFPEVTNEKVVKHYLREDNTPWYTATAK